MAVNAATKIPWKEILKALPFVADTAKELWNQWNSKPKAPAVDLTATINTQIAAIVGRLQSLEAAEVAQADLVKQITEQLQGVSAGLTETSSRLSIAIWVSTGALAVSCGVLLLVALRYLYVV